jgi:hypothetical protein
MTAACESMLVTASTLSVACNSAAMSATEDFLR